MASATPLHPTTKETSNYARLCRLLVEVGSHVLREIFDRIYPPGNLHTVLNDPKNHAKLQTLRKKRVLTTSQWHKLYPVIKSPVSSGNFDTPLLLFLLRNIWGLTLPASGQDDLPLVTDTTPAADITRIKILRDRVYSHVTSGSVDDPTFSCYWNDIKDTFQRIGGARYQDVINDLKTDCMDADIEKEYQERFREWLKDEDCITEKSHEDEMVKKARKEDDLEGSIETYQQNSGKEGLSDLLLLILRFKLFFFVSIMFDIVDHEIKGFTSNIFVWKVIGALYIKEKFCVFFFLML